MLLNLILFDHGKKYIGLRLYVAKTNLSDKHFDIVVVVERLTFNTLSFLCNIKKYKSLHLS